MDDISRSMVFVEGVVMSTEGQSFSSQLGAEVKKASGWYIALGVVMLIGGIAAVAKPLHAGVTVTFIVGWVLIINGVMTGVNALMARGAGGFLWRVLMAVIYVAGGLYVLRNPIEGLAALTLVLGVVLVFGGIMKLMTAAALTGVPGVGLLMAAGIVSIIVGILIWAKLPEASEVVVGTLIGLAFIMNGISIIVFGTGARKMGGTVAGT